MSAIKISARIIAAATVALGLVASCGQLLGDLEVIRPGLLPVPDGGMGPNEPVVICEAGITECAGRALQLCTDDGTGWATLEICETADLCETSDNSTVSACLEPTCAVDQMSCDGNMLRLCNAMRTGWELFDACETAAHCDAGNRQCLPAPCEPGDRRCNVGNLERCNDTRTAWESLDSCETNELCEATLVPVATTSEVISTSQLPPPPANAEGPTGCLQPVCIPREVQCDVNRLLACNPGQTALTLFEECATPKLCEASIAYTGRRGSPRCVRPTCAQGEHRCTDSGVLEVCNADRDGYDPIEACIGAPFCNAVAADNGQPGCEDAPCEAGEMQCNGPQIQVCTADRTRFDPLGGPCETRGLCNDDNNRAAFCQVAACQRGAFSGSEFRCEAATLLRCNDQHTGFDPIGNCATPGLCNAALGFFGCQPPVCFPGETRCNGNFVQRCNEQRTGFDNIEQCAAGTCDSALGRCADPCVVGSARCNAQGNLEECRNLLVGREITARCGSPQLCDASARQCRTPPQGCTADGVRRCRQTGATSVLEECTDGRSRFVTLDTCAAGEVCDPNDISCDACVQGSEPTCEGNSLAVCSSNGQTESNTNCANGCQVVTPGADRCRNCVPGAVSCDGFQLVVCRQRNGTEVPDRENCATNALCQQTIQNCTGENCRCQVGVCDPGERQCNGGQPEVCNAGQTAFVADGANCGVGNCNPQTGRCFACGVGDVACNAGVLFGCAADRSGFTERLGSQRCLRDNNGHRSQSCNGNQLIDSRCPAGSLICVDGFGCQECDPNNFESECTTVGGAAGTTECLGGEIQSFACTGDGACVDAVCEGDGDCNTQASPPGTACTRAGGGSGVCDGAPAPTCVECLQNPAAGSCNDNNPCTDDSCSGTRCNHPNNTRPCTLPGGGAGICSAGSCGALACSPNETRCVGAQFQTCNANRTGFVTADTCDSAALCGPSGCGTPCDDDQCEFGCNDDRTGCNPCNPAQCNGRDPATCADRVCSGTQCALSAPECRAGLCIGGTCRQCANDDDCQGALVCDIGSNTCVPPQPQCDPAACPFPNQCNPNGSCVACDNDVTCPDTPGSCNISVCGANDCADTPAPFGAPCPIGQCDGDGNCLPPPEPEPPPAGEPPNQGGGDPGNPGGGNGNNGGGNGNGGGGINPLCDGVCDLLDALLCAEDCE